jgi:hypothetical protein
VINVSDKIPQEEAYVRAEAEAAESMERLVSGEGFSSLLGMLGQNVAAFARIGSESMDLLWRNLRVAGRRDVVRLSGQIARTEDKLERLLQEVERIQDDRAQQPTLVRADARPPGVKSRR